MTERTLHYRTKPVPNEVQDIVSPQNSELLNLRFGVTCLDADRELNFHDSIHETVVVLLQGQISVKGNELEGTLSRTSVFHEKPSATYIPVGVSARIYADKTSEFAVIRAIPRQNHNGAEIILVHPDDVKPRIVGKNSWCRIVQDIIPVDFPASIPVLGETINEAGKWSSCPPHKHDQDNLPHESKHEEIYYYRTNPSQGFGLQRVYTADRELDVTYAVEQGDVVVLPRGYHPVVAGPGYQLYYLWVLAGDTRETQWAEDPEHSWIHEIPSS